MSNNKSLNELPGFEPRGWRWSPLLGIMYGPIPVGLIFAIPIGLAIAMSR